MKKKQFLVTGVDTQNMMDCPIEIIVQSPFSEDAIDLVKQDDPELGDRWKWFVRDLTKVKRLKPKDITIKEVMQTAFSEEQLVKTIQMYEDMLLKGINFKTLGDVFAPYLIMYDHKIENCLISKSITREQLKEQGKIAGKIIEIGFRYLPKKKKPFKNEDQNYNLWYQKQGSFHSDDFKLVLKQGTNGGFQEWTFVDFVIEVTKIIPDVPVRLEKVVIENL